MTARERVEKALEIAKPSQGGGVSAPKFDGTRRCANCSYGMFVFSDGHAVCYNRDCNNCGRYVPAPTDRKERES